VATLAATVLPAGINVNNNVLNYTFNGTGKISGPVGLVKQGSSALILDNSGSNDFTGVVNILGGSLQIGNNDANGLLPSVSVINNGTLIFNRTDSNTAANVISGTGGVTKNSSGTLTLSGATSSYGGGTIVNAGALRSTGVTALGTGGVTVNTGGILVETGGDATNNPITMAGGVLGVTAADFILATTSSLTIAANTTNIIQSADPQNPSTSRNIQVDGLVSGSGVAVVLNATNITSPDGNQGVRFRATASSDFSGTIIYTNNTKGELAVSGAGPFSPVGTGKLILYAGAYDGGNTLTCPASGGYVEFNIRNSGGTTTIPTDFQIAGSGAVVFNGLGTGNGAVATLGNLKIGGGQEVIGYRGAGTTTNTINFPTVTLTGGSATLSPHSTSFGAANQAGADLSLGNISETSASGIIKAGIGNLTLTGLNAYTGNTTVSNGTLFLSGDSALTNSPVIKIAAGSLDVSARNDQTLTLISGQTLFANGTVNGALTASGGSTLSPGAGAGAIGTLTVNGTVTADLQGTTLMEINKTNAPGTNDLIVASTGTINYGGTLTVSNLGPALVAGDSFKLFNSGITSGTFAATNLPPLNTGLAWTNILLNGTLSVVATVNPNPTNITAVVSGNTLTLSWPADHTGWRLQAQTNSINTGLNSNWVDVPGSATVNSVSVTINPTNGTVFFRMVYP
jgi:autotransporter-associated beta strand protein